MRYARLRDKNHQTATAMTAMTIIPMSIFPIYSFYPAVRRINLTALHTAPESTIVRWRKIYAG
jgi:hypothetical protein